MREAVIVSTARTPIGKAFSYSAVKFAPVLSRSPIVEHEQH